MFTWGGPPTEKKQESNFWHSLNQKQNRRNTSTSASVRNLRCRLSFPQLAILINIYFINSSDYWLCCNLSILLCYKVPAFCNRGVPASLNGCLGQRWNLTADVIYMNWHCIWLTPAVLPLQNNKEILLCFTTLKDVLLSPNDSQFNRTYCAVPEDIKDAATACHPRIHFLIKGRLRKQVGTKINRKIFF